MHDRVPVNIYLFKVEIKTLEKVVKYVQNNEKKNKKHQNEAIVLFLF